MPPGETHIERFARAKQNHANQYIGMLFDWKVSPQDVEAELHNFDAIIERLETGEVTSSYTLAQIKARLKAIHLATSPIKKLPNPFRPN